MAILWRKEVNGTNYEVRSAGATRRLYTDGVFHSQYNPDKSLAGGIWDLLLLPAFFSTQDKIKRVLVLGVGGGAVIQQLQRYISPDEIIGVELNPIHLYVARKFFSISKSVADLHEADAIQWLKDYKGPKFDLIIEDLFSEDNGEPVRAVVPTAQWFNLLNKNMSQQGILVMNFISHTEFRDAAYFSSKSLTQRFKSVFQLSLPLYENRIGVFLKQQSSSGQLRERLLKISGLRNFKYQIRKIIKT